MYDRDVVGSDDFMGRAEFDLTSLELDKSQEVTLILEDGGDEDLIRYHQNKLSTPILFSPFLICDIFCE